MQTIVLVLLCVLVAITKQKFVNLSIKASLNNRKHLLMEFPNRNITIPLYNPNISIPKLNVDDIHMIILLFQ